MDKEIKILMKRYEVCFSKKIAITYTDKENQTRDSWIDSPMMKF